MKIKTIIQTTRKGEIYLTEHDLAVMIGKLLGANAPEITVNELDWDISQGSLVNGVNISWEENDAPREVEKELLPNCLRDDHKPSADGTHCTACGQSLSPEER